MLKNNLMLGVLTVGTAAALVGCGMPNTTPTSTTAAPEAASTADRQLMAVGEAESFNQVRATLPQQISVADADRMLETVDPSKIVGLNEYTVQQRGRIGGFGLGRGFGRGFYGGFGRHYGGYGGYRFFRHRNFLYPYYRYGGFYRPYYYGSYYPFLYSYRNLCYPYTYSSLWY